MAQQKYYLTKEKHDDLVKELEELRTSKRKEVADALEYARALGDLSENAEYQEAREAQAALEERIAVIKAILKNVEIIKEHHSTVAEPGSIVTIKREGETDPKVLCIVGSTETDFASGKISNESPLGIALIGRKKGESFEFKTAKGVVVYTITNIA